MSENKRVQQSKQLIGDALMTLMEQYSFQDVGISQICQEATVSRNTFYRIYHSKEEVLCALIQNKIKTVIGLFDQLEHYNVLLPSRTDVERTLQRFYSFWAEEKAFLKMLLRRGVFHYLHSEFKISSQNKGSEVWIDYYTKRASGSLQYYYYPWLSDSFCSILECWTVRDFEESPEELARMTIELFQSVGYHRDSPDRS